MSKIPFGRLATAAALIVVLGSSAPGQVHFETGRTLAAGTAPVSVMAEDFDQDGVADLCILGDPVSVRLGDGDGGFGPSIVLGGPFHRAASGDLDGDTVTDLVLASTGPFLGVFLGRGDGTFALGVGFNAEGSVHDVQLADVDEDGNVDAVVAARAGDGTPGGVFIFRGDGEAGFELANGPGLELLRDVVDVELVDFDGDEHLDLAAAVAVGSLGRPCFEIYKGDGSGGFERIFFHEPAGVAALAIVDLDADDRPDVVAVSEAEGDGFLVRNTLAGFELATGIASPATAVTGGDLDGHPGPEIVTIGSGEGELGDAVALHADLLSDNPPAPVILSQGSGPARAAIADWDGDGRNDLAVANAGGEHVALFLTRGQESLPVARRLPVGPQPAASATALWDEDGHPDVLVGHAEGVTILRGTDEGILESFLEIGSFHHTRDVAIGDLDEDGHLDVVASGDRELTVGLGDGNGGFVRGPSVAASTAPVGEIVTADVTGNGHLDVVVATDASSLLVFEGDGAGGLALVSTMVVIGTPRSLLVAEVDGDPDPEIVVSSDLVVTFADRDGGEFATRLLDLPPGVAGSIASGELTGDGIPDLILTDQRTVWLLVGDGVGGFAAQTLVDFPGNRILGPPATGDLDGDGNQDLVVPDSFRHQLLVLFGNGAGEIDRSNRIDVRAVPREVLIEEISGDSNPDVLVAFDTNPAGSGNNFRKLGVLVGLGAGELAIESGYATGRSGHTAIRAGDLDEDGLVDVIVSTEADSTVNVLFGSGAGELGRRRTFGVGDGVTRLVTGDFDGDGRTDVLSASGNKTVSLLPGGGDGRSALPEVFLATITGEVGAIAAVDVDGDGIQDAITANGDAESYSLLRGRADGGLAEAEETDIGMVSNHLAVGDFNEDGRVDLVVAAEETPRLAVIIHDGAGGFAAPSFIPRRNGIENRLVRSLEMGDVDGDRNLDVVVSVVPPEGRIRRPGQAVLFGTGRGTFGGRIFTETGIAPSRLELVDLDLDDRLDLVLPAEDLSGVAVARGLGHGSFEEVTTFGPVDAPRFVDTLDVNRDGEIDVLGGGGDDGLFVLLNTTSFFGSRRGTVTDRDGNLEDVLFVNDSAGRSASRALTVGSTEPFEFRVDAPSSTLPGERAPFALYVWFGHPEAGSGSIRRLPLDLGTTTLPTPLTDGDADPIIILNNFGSFGRLGRPTDPSFPAPFSVSKAGGVGRVGKFYVQGLIFNPESRSEVPGSVTNAIALTLEE